MPRRRIPVVVTLGQTAADESASGDFPTVDISGEGPLPEVTVTAGPAPLWPLLIALSVIGGALYYMGEHAHRR